MKKLLMIIPLTAVFFIGGVYATGLAVPELDSIYQHDGDGDMNYIKTHLTGGGIYRKFHQFEIMN